MMTLEEIIKKDEDRVFAVDPECFIIFTGETISDTRPFIRIGNWIDLPAGIIPLIENIIVTDTMAGNPAHEQFNIDIKFLPVNRYIGSHSIVRRFLDYQKIFGLDLHNASVVDAERDIPDISTSSAVSDRESFMGIFYNDGNFRIVHNKKKIFDLNESCGTSLTSNEIHEALAAAAKNQKRYAGSGMVIIDGNPLFYRNSAFASYLFPLRYYAKFSGLGISPRSIHAVIHPSENFLSFARFLKWKHTSASKITVYSDSKDEIALQKSLFSKAKIDGRPFSGMKEEIIPGLTITQKMKSFNISALFDNQKVKIKTAFIKGPSSLSQIAAEKYDALFVPYSVFEDSLSALRSSASPAAVIDDGNPSVSKVPRLEYPVLRQNVQYEFILRTDDEEILKLMTSYLPADITDAIIGRDYAFLERMQTSIGTYHPEEVMNAASLATYLISVTADRKFSTFLKGFARELLVSEYRNKSYENPGIYRFDLILTGKGIYEFAFKVQENENPQIFCPDELREETEPASRGEEDVCRMIMADRERLEKLLELYRHDPVYVKEMESLRIEIEKRKDAFHKERDSHPEKGKDFILGLRSSINRTHKHRIPIYRPFFMIRRSLISRKDQTIPQQKTAHGKPKTRKERKKEIRSLRSHFITAGIVLALLLSTAGIVMLFHSTAVQKKLEMEQARVQSAANEKMKLKEKYHITINDYDVYLFANKTAQKNGFAPIPVKDFKKKNPHWIYPGNVFILADGEEVKVKDGDTLWKISRAKLERSYLDFYVVIDSIEKDIKSGKKPDPAAVRTAQSLAMTEGQKKLAAVYDGNQ